VTDPELPEETPGHLTERTLREFAGLCLAIFGVLFVLSWYRHVHAPSPSGWVAGALVLLVGVQGLIRPNAIRPIYLLAMALTKPIGHVIGGALLAIVYYGVITPLAVAFRVAGRDGLGRFRSNSESYWVDRLPSNDVRRYLRQYQRATPGERAPSGKERRSASGRIAACATVPRTPITNPK
jgi:hypothetical protein